MPNLIQRAFKWMNSPIGKKTAGVGRVTPRYSTTEDESLGYFLLSDYHYIAHPVEGQRGYRTHAGTLDVDYQLTNFDFDTLPNISLKKMINLLKNNSASISQGAQNFKTALTYGYKLEGSPRAKTNIQKIFRMLEKRRKPISLLLGQMADGIFFGGGVYREIVLAPDKETTIDYVVNDPTTVKFEFIKDTLYGEVFELIKLEKNGKIINIESDPTIQYLPINSDVNSPFGKPYLLAGIFPAVWQLLVLKDFRDVLRTQISPFVHVKIDTEKILEITGGDEKQALDLAKTYRDTAIDQWKKKGPDTAVGSGDEVSYEIISGLNQMNIGMINPIIRMLRSEIASGINTMPLFIGNHDGTTETNADVQWLIQTAILRSVIRELNVAITSDLNIMNQAAGIGGEVLLTLLEMNAMERLREANIFKAEEEALIKLADHLSKAFAEKTITMEQMLKTYEQRRDLIYHSTLE